MAAIEIQFSAEQLLSRHGHDAWARTVAGAEASAAIGDWEQVGVWRRIGGAVRALERRAEAGHGDDHLLHALTAAVTHPTSSGYAS